MMNKPFHASNQRGSLAYHVAAGRLRTTKITKTADESPTVKTFNFTDKECARARPGQFLMLWVPGLDEIPLSISDANADNTVSVTVKKVGEATLALHGKKVGDIIGVRGPFGNSFSDATGRILMVGGGTGMAPLLFLTKSITGASSKVALLMGAKTANELLFKDAFERVLGKRAEQLLVMTEDGSRGIKGLCTDRLEELLRKEEFDRIFTCGPEQMIRKVFDSAENHGIEVEASLERLMRCAIGLCGSCIIGRYRVCRDGPVFNSEQMREFRKELGISKRDFDGRRVPL